MTRMPSIVAALAVLASGPAAAYSTRYEVRHYPAAFTRTVNQAIGTATESYADGSVGFDFGTAPAPSLAVSATEAGTTAFDIDASYEFAVSVAPVTAAAQALFVALGQNVPHIKVGEAKGTIRLTAAAGSGTALSAMVDQPNGTGFNLACTGGVHCGTTAYHTALFLDALGYNPYACTGTCTLVAFGTPLTLVYNMTAHVQVYGGPGTTASLLIDPVLSLDPDFLSDAGLSASDFTITPEPGFGNSAASVPEPAVWLMLLAGFGFVGAALRHRYAAA